MAPVGTDKNCNYHKWPITRFIYDLISLVSEIHLSQLQKWWQDLQITKFYIFLKQLYDPSLRTIFCIMAWKQPDNRDLQKFMRSYQNKKENKSIPNSLIKINNNHFHKEISI